MNFDKVKNISSIKLDGITVNADRVGDNVHILTLTDKSGNVLRFERENSYSSLNIYVKAEPKKEKRFHVHGNIDDISISKLYEEKYEAEQKVRDYATLKMEEVEVIVDDDGKVTDKDFIPF